MRACFNDTTYSSRVIETVCKENVFNKEITEKERDIIAKRVALQQRQFAAYEQREKYRKAVKIKAMFGCLTEQEIEELLNEFDQDEVNRQNENLNKMGAYGFKLG